jgi:RimJ/RimL family protein N-acetyltransferase
MLKDDFYIEFKKTHTKSFFSFPEIPSFKNFSFEKLTEQNFEQLYLLFEGDSSPFVDERFKTFEGAKEHAKFISTCGAFLPKHGGQDWLFKWNSEYAGILHLYDLSLETFADNHKRAWVGFATAEKFRKSGVSFRAVNYFINYIFDNYKAIDFIHSMTRCENKIASNFIQKCGFELDQEDRSSQDYVFFVRERDEVENDFVLNRFDETEWTW